MTTNLPDLAHLLALAEAATPGPWFTWEEPDTFEPGEIELWGVGTGKESDDIICTDTDVYGPHLATGRYIAAMSPDVCRALIAEVQRLRGLLADIRLDCTVPGCDSERPICDQHKMVATFREDPTP